MSQVVDFSFLYNTLPDVIRVNDPDGAIEAYMQGVAGMHFHYLDFIEGLPDLVDPETAPADFLVELAKTVGVELEFPIPEDIKRLLIQRAIAAYKVKGTHLGFRILMRSLGLDGAVLELWSDYNLQNFAYTPDVQPVVGGAENPSYDPTNTTDGLIKYKTSFWDLQVYQIAPTVPPSIISTLIEKIETVRPLTRTLRKIFFAAEPPGDEVDMEDDLAVTGRFLLQDAFPGFTCLFYSCDTQPGRYYDGSLGVYDSPLGPFYDYYPFTCDVFYDNAQIALYDGVLIADYSGLSDSQGEPYTYGLVSDVTLRYDCGGKADELDIVFATLFQDAFPGRGTLYYDNDPSAGGDVYYDNAYSFDYSGNQGVFDELDWSIVKQFDETVSMDDEIEFVAGIELGFDKFNDSIAYDGEEGHTYSGNCITYDYDFDYYYDGAHGGVYDGGLGVYNHVSVLFYDNATNIFYDCAGLSLFYDNSNIGTLDELLGVASTVFSDTVSVDDDADFAAVFDLGDDTFAVPADDLQHYFAKSLEDLWPGCQFYDELELLYDGLSGLLYNNACNTDFLDITATVPDDTVSSDDDLEIAVPVDVEDPVSISDDADNLVALTDYDTFMPQYLYGDNSATYGYLVIGPGAELIPFFATYAGFGDPVRDSLDQVITSDFDETVSMSDPAELVIYGADLKWDTLGSKWDDPSLKWDTSSVSQVIPLP